MTQTSRSNPAIGGIVPTQCEDGERVYRTEVHAQEVIFLDSNGNGGNGRTNGNGSREAAEAGAETADVF